MKKIGIVLTLFLLTCLFSGIAYAGVIYVDTEAEGDNTGMSWEDAFTDLQNGLDLSDEGDVIRVRAGTYTAPAVDIDSGLATFRMKSGVDIVSEGGPQVTILRIAGGGATGTVVTAQNVTDALLEGFTITQGNAFAGGGMVVSGGNPVVRNCIFTHNQSYSGGGLLCGETALVLTNCIFKENFSMYGGGVYTDTCSPTMTNCIFSGNVAAFAGGGMFNQYSGPKLTNCLFFRNTSAQGGGIGNMETLETLTLVNCTFYGNMSGAMDGETWVNGLGGGVFNGASSPKVANCIFWEDAPAAIYNDATSSPIVTYSLMDEDPVFVREPFDGGDGWGDDPDTPDVDEGANDDLGDLRLQVGSSCIDAGDNEAVPPDVSDLDKDGNTTEPIPVDLSRAARFFDDAETEDTGNGSAPVVDMGAYEYAGPVCENDFNGDGDVDGSDLAEFATGYGVEWYVNGLEALSKKFGRADCPVVE